MSSFIEKLNKRGIGKDRAPEVPQPGQAQGPGQGGAGKLPVAPDGALQVDVDVQQSLYDITICAPVPGADIEDIRVTVAGEGDVVIIEGERKKPEVFTAVGDSMKTGETAMYVAHECQWGKFWRKVVLPVEVEPTRAQAALGKGLLIVTLPLKKPAKDAAGGVQLNVTSSEK